MLKTMETFDATQLEFRKLKKLDEDNIIWRTIRGNKVPLPKNGTREEKAQAIKEWFASKNKPVPSAKGQYSVYAARFEHEAPSRKAKKSGEGEAAHGEGQYTLKSVLKDKRYFDMFKSKYVKFNAPDDFYENMPDIYGDTGSLVVGRGDWRNVIERILKRAEHRMSKYGDIKRSLSDAVEYLKQEKFKTDYDHWSSEIIYAMTQHKDKLVEKFSQLKESDFRLIPTRYMVKGEPVMGNEDRRWMLKFMVDVPERTPESLENLKQLLSGPLAAKIESWEDIKPAKAQMSVVEIPAEKYYFKEDTPFRKQSKYVQQRLFEPWVDNNIRFKMRHWSSTSGKNFDINMFKENHPDQYQFLVDYGKAAVKRIDELDREKTPEYDWTTNGIKDAVRREMGGRIGQMLRNVESGQLSFFSPKEPETSYYSASGQIIEEVRPADWNRGFFNARSDEEVKHISEQQATKHGNMTRSDFEGIMGYLAGEAGSFYRGKATLKETDLRKAGIKGFSYYGHQDKYGNVTFDPKEIIVKKRTTNPAEIREWIRKQVKIRPEFYQDDRGK